MRLILAALSALLLFSAAFSFAYAESGMKPRYAKAVVQPVTVRKLPNHEISIRYHVFPESSHYSNGVSYEKTGDVLKIVINRCSVGETCEPMAKTVIPLDEKWEAEVHLPYHGEKLMLIHTDAADPIYP